MAKKVESKLVKGYISGSVDTQVKAKFVGEVEDKFIRWPKELGVEHPFDFCDVEKLYKKSGLINGGLNKITNNIVGEFTVHSDDTNALAIANKFIESNNFSVVLREWIREALLKGNGFMEIDLKEQKVRVINANNIYVVRDKFGNVTGYNQYVGSYEKFNQKKVIPLKVENIAHLKINCIAGEAYGIGVVWPSERIIENMIIYEQGIHQLMQRKAGAPIHVKVGVPGEGVNKQDIDDFKTLLQFMNNKTEWVTDANVEMKVLDFGDIGKNLMDAWMNDFRQLIAGMDIPEYLMNSGQLNEGIAIEQREGWHANLKSRQEQVEGIIIEKLFKPLLKGVKNFDIDFIWNLPSDDKINARLEKLSVLNAQMGISPNLKRMIELEIARLLNLQDAEEYLRQPMKGLDDEKEAEMAKNQPEFPGSKPNFTKKQTEGGCTHIHETFDFEPMSVKEFIEIKEANGFTYSDYLVAILKRLKKDGFTDLKALTESDLGKGLLSDSDIEKLRTILKNGFKENLTMKQIKDQVAETIKFKDRITEDGKTIPASTRPEMVTRTEVVRISNEGLIDLYKENNVKNVIWTATLSERTCERCMQKDGQIYPITEAIGDNRPPLHVNCRCALIAS